MKKLLRREGNTLALGHMCNEGLHQNQPQRLLQLFLTPHNVNSLFTAAVAETPLGSLHPARKLIQPWLHSKGPVPLPHPTQCQHCWREGTRKRSGKCNVLALSSCHLLMHSHSHTHALTELMSAEHPSASVPAAVRTGLGRWCSILPLPGLSMSLHPRKAIHPLCSASHPTHHCKDLIPTMYPFSFLLHQFSLSNSSPPAASKHALLSFL